MAEQADAYEWRTEGEEAEIVLYSTNDAALERVLPTATLPGVLSPAYAAASENELGWVAVSESYVAPDLISSPVRGLLLTADVAVGGLGMQPRELPRLLRRNLAEVRLPLLGGAGVRRICELGARAMAEDGFIEEEDLQFFGDHDGEPDSLVRRALSAGERDWDRLGEVGAHAVGEVIDTERAEAIGMESGRLFLSLRVGAGDLGRLAISGHRERMLGRIWSGSFDTDPEMPAAPAGSEEAVDFLAAANAAANFADGRAALLIYVLRRALEEAAGWLVPAASWTIGGIEERDGALIHRKNLAVAGEEKILCTGSSVAAGTGKMWGSAPPFEVPEDQGRWPWEEAGLLERLAKLDPLED